jgi:hypothetical protein
MLRAVIQPAGLRQKNGSFAESLAVPEVDIRAGDDIDVLDAGCAQIDGSGWAPPRAGVPERVPQNIRVQTRPRVADVPFRARGRICSLWWCRMNVRADIHPIRRATSGVAVGAQL